MRVLAKFGASATTECSAARIFYEPTPMETNPPAWTFTEREVAGACSDGSFELLVSTAAGAKPR